MKIPESIIADVENEVEGLTHGIVTLQLHIRDTHLSHYKINREKSVVTLTRGEGDPDVVKNYGANYTGMRTGMRK